MPKGTGNVGIGTTAPLVKLDIISTDAVHLPNGTTLQRPTGVAGYLRFNSNSLGLEYHDGTQWVPVNMEQTPIGTIVPFAGPSIPTGWLLCDGQTPLRAGTYAALFAAIGTTWGTGNGSTTFHIPDLRGRFPRGVDGAAGRDPDNASRTASNAGGGTGNALGSVQADATIGHTHNVAGTSAGSGALTAASNGDHAHSWGNWWSIDNASVVGSGQGDGSGNTYSDGYVGYWNNNFPVAAAGDHNHGMTTRQDDYNVSGGSGPSFGADNGTYANYNFTANAGNHTHNVYMPNHRHWIQARNTTTTGAHTHSIADHSHGFNVTSGAATGATSTESRPENAYVQYIIKATSTSTVAIVSPNIPNGINGQTLRYNSGSGLWVANSFLYNDEANIGIGTSTPSFRLDMPNSGTINARLGLAETGTWPAANTYAYWGHEALDHSLLGNYGLLQSNVGQTLLNSATGQVISFRHNNADQMTLNAGSLGIGTTTPAGKLHVVTSSNDGNTSAWSDGNFVVGQAGTTGGAIALSYNTSNNAGYISALAPAVAWKDLGLRALNTIFYYNGATEGMRLTTGGNLGIGSNAPGYKLDVAGDINLAGNADLRMTGVPVLFGSSTDVYANIRVLQNNSTATQDGMYINYNSTGGTAADIRFYANGTNERMRILGTNGNVGIGNSGPGYKLHVSGDIYADGGWFRVSGNQGLFFESHGTGIQSVTADGGEYGSVSTYGNEGGWDGFTIDGRYVLMGSGNTVGLYNDIDNRWQIQIDRGAGNDGFRFFNSQSTNLNMRIQHTNGTSYASYDGDNNWDFYSDRRLKENIEKEENILDRLIKLDVVNYDFINQDRKDKEIGFIAQEVEKYFPSIVSETADDRYDFKVKALGYSSFGILAVGAIKELKIEKDKEIAELKEEIEKLKSGSAVSSENTELKSEIAELKKMLLELEKKVNTK